MRRPDDVVDGFLPLRPVEFQILLSLSSRELHGYAIIRDAELRGEGSAVPGLATLYRALRRLKKSALIEEAGDADAGSHDAGVDGSRRRVFCLTETGRAVARAEAQRLEKLLRAARHSRLLEDRSS